MKTSTCKNPQKPTNLDWNDTTILSRHPYILYHLPNMPCLCYCVHRRVVEGGGVGCIAWVYSACGCMMVKSI